MRKDQELVAECPHYHDRDPLIPTERVGIA